MAYFLGIDIGTTYTAAAVWRESRYEIASLGNRAPTIPSVVLLRDDETVLTGEAAVRRAASEPSRVAREFKRRIGDPTPIIVGGTPYSADALVAKLLRWVVDHVASVEGGPAASIAVSHPANWGAYKLDLLGQALRLADLDHVVTVSEPEAAAIHYASQERVEPGSVIAVYDLGGGTFDAAVLRKTGTGWEILGTPEGIERLGGVDFDEAVYHHVAQALGGAIEGLDPLDPTAQAAVARLRQECVDAKEALSSDSDVSIPVLLPNLQTEVRLTRAEYESMVRPALADTITAMNRALRSAGVEAEAVTAVLLVGGSSRTPLVAELVSSALGRPVAVDAHPKYGVALGAAITAAQREEGSATSPSAARPSSSPLPAPPPPASPRLAAPSPESAVAPAAVVAPLVIGPTTGDGSPPPRSTGPADTTPAPRVEASAEAATSLPSTAATPLDPPPPTAATDRRVSAPPPFEPTRRDTRSVTIPYGGDQVPPGADRAPQSRGGGRGNDDGRGDGYGGGNGGDPRSRRPAALVGGAMLAVALVVGGAYIALSGGDDDPAATADTAGDTDAVDSSTATSPTEPSTTTTPAPAGPFVQVHDVVLDGEQYRVNYQVIGFEPLVEGGPDSLHVHFFLNTTAPENAGNNGNPVGTWNLTDETASFLTEFGPETKGEATQMCSAVATVGHDVHLQGTATGNCVDLPPDA